MGTKPNLPNRKRRQSQTRPVHPRNAHSHTRAVLPNQQARKLHDISESVIDIPLPSLYNEEEVFLYKKIMSEYKAKYNFGDPEIADLINRIAKSRIQLHRVDHAEDWVHIALRPLSHPSFAISYIIDLILCNFQPGVNCLPYAPRTALNDASRFVAVVAKYYCNCINCYLKEKENGAQDSRKRSETMESIEDIESIEIGKSAIEIVESVDNIARLCEINYVLAILMGKIMPNLHEQKLLPRLLGDARRYSISPFDDPAEEKRPDLSKVKPPTVSEKRTQITLIPRLQKVRFDEEKHLEMLKNQLRKRAELP